MVHTGTPGGRRLYGPRTLADADRRQLRLISYDRPGYGGSTPQPGRSTADCASDVRVICEALGIDRLAMLGTSGGGPHVLACAALLPDLVPAVAALASLAPYDAEGLDWLAGFSQAALDEVRLMLTDESGARALFEEEREKLLGAPPAQVALDLQARMPGYDLALLTDEAVSVQQAMEPGIEGAWDDCVAQMTPWGFDVAQISGSGAGAARRPGPGCAIQSRSMAGRAHPRRRSLVLRRGGARPAGRSHRRRGRLAPRC
jgi:pimeloyl-ACP methyl ester carboxylesterase